MGDQFGIFNKSINEVIESYQRLKQEQSDFVGSTNGESNLGLMFKAAFEQSTELGDYLKTSAESDIAKYVKATEEMSGTLGELDLTLITSNDAMRGYLGTIENGAVPSMEGFKTYCKESGLALKEMTLAQNAAAIGARALSVAMNALVGIGISIVISAAVKAFDKFVNRLKYASEAVDTAKSKIAEIESSLKSQKSTIKESGQEFAELSQHINQFNHTNLDLNEEDYKKFLDLNSKLAQQFPEMISGYDSNGEAILNLKGNIVEVNQKLEEYIEKAEKASTVKIVEAFKGTGENDDFFKGMKTLIDKDKESLIQYEQQFKEVENGWKDFVTIDKGEVDLFGNYFLGTKERNKTDIIRKYWEASGFDKKLNYNEIVGGSIGNLSKDQMGELFRLLEDRNIDGQLTDQAVMGINQFLLQNSDQTHYTIESLKDYVTQSVSDTNIQYEQLISDIDSKNKEIAKNAQFVLQESSLWQKESDSNQQLMSDALNYIDWSDPVFNGFDGDKAANYIQTTFVSSLSKLDDSEKISLSNFFRTDIDNEDLSSYLNSYNTIKEIFETHEIQIPISITGIQHIQDRFNEEYNKLSNTDKNILDDYFIKNNINSVSEIDLWNQRTQGYDTALEKISAYEKKKEEIVQKEKETKSPLLSFSKAWKELDNADDTKEAKENLLSLAEAGKLTVEAFEDSSVAENFLKQTGLSAEQATQKINKLIEDVKQLNAMRTGITAITSAYDEKKDSKKNTVSASTLDSMATTLGVGDWDKKDKKVWQEYKDTAGNSAASLKDLKTAQDELATSFVNSNNFLTNLNDANKDYYTTLLTEMGVVNSSAVVEKGLRVQRANLALSTYESAKSEKERKTALDGLKKNLQNCTKEEKEFYFAKLLSNGENLDTTQECNELMLLGQELKIESSLLDSLKAKILDMNNVHARSTVTLETIEVHRVITNNTASSNAINGANATTDRNKQGSNSFGYNASAGLNSKTKSKTQIKAEQEAKELQNRIKLGIQTSKGNKTNSSSSSGSGKNSGSGSGNKSTWSAWGTEIDWIAKKIDVLNNKISLLDATYQNLPVASTDQIKKANKTLTDEIKTYSKLISTYGTAEKKYNKKAEKTLISYRYEKQSKTVGKGKNKKTVVKNKKVANSKLSKKQIAEVRKRVDEGKLSSKTSIKQLIKTYGSEKAETIQQYLNYLEQANSAAQNKQSAIASRREKQIQKKQNYADYYQSQSDLADLRASDTSDTVKNRNKYLDSEINSQKKYYENLIAIAKLEKDSTEQAKLQEEWQQKRLELQKQQLQNLIDEQNALANLYSAQAGQNANYTSSASGTYKNQNKYIEQQKEAIKKSYEYQIKIAKLDNDKTEQNRLELELEKQLVDLTQQEIDNIKTAYQNRIGYIDNANSDLDNAINLLSARGATVGSAYYNGKSTADQAQLKLVQEERAALQSQLANVTKYSDEWYSLQEDIQSLDDTESSLRVDIANNNTAVRDLAKAISDAVIAMDDNVKSEAQFVAGLLDNKESFEKASITNEGLAKLGVYGFSAEADEASINQIRRDRNAVQNAKVGSTVKVNGIDITFDSQEQIKEALNELIKQEQEYTSSLYDDYQGIIDFVKEYYESQLSYMKELIDAKKSLIEEEKEQYEYEKTIAEKTKNIATLQKQLAALQGDNSEEGRARRSALQVSLDEANQDLQDTEYDKYLSNQEQMLDNLYSEYENMLQALMKDSDALLQQGIDLMNQNIPAIVSVLGNTSDNWGYNYTENFQTITDNLRDGNVSITKIGDEISTVDSSIAMLGENLKSQFNSSEQNALTDVKNILDNIKGTLDTISGNMGSNSSVNTSSDKDNSSGSFNGNSVEDKNKAIQRKASQNISLVDFLSKHSGSGNDKPLRAVKQGETKDTFKSALNKKLFEFGYVVKSGVGTHGDSYINMFAKLLGLSGGNSYDENGDVYKKLKEQYSLLGFQTGGIIRASGVPLNGDNIPVRVNPNETILTQKFTDILPQTVEKMDTFNRLLTMNPDKYSSVSSGNTIGDVIINADMSGVESPYDFVRELQTNQKVQKAVTVAVNDLMTKGKITKNVQKVR